MSGGTCLLPPLASMAYTGTYFFSDTARKSSLTGYHHIEYFELFSILVAAVGKKSEILFVPSHSSTPYT
jgi:hypothetical protein